MYCKNCGEELKEHQEVCLVCGVEKNKGNKHCFNCGVGVSTEAAICTKCGVKLQSEKEKNTSKGEKVAVEKTTYVVLAFLFGGIGAHKFYAKNMLMGFLYLIFCWTFVPGILALIDAITALQQEKDENGFIYV